VPCVIKEPMAMIGIRHSARRLLYSLASSAIFAGSVAHHVVALASRPSTQTHIITCKETPIYRTRPNEMECALLAHKQIESLPREPIVWRLETFTNATAARRAEGRTSVFVRSGAKSWLLTLGTKGQRTPGGTSVTEIGPIAIPRALHYGIVVGEAYSRPGATTRVHTHPGPEAWYLLAGAQCLEMPGGVLRARAGQSSFAAANMPMKLSVVGTANRDALFFVVGDAVLPWTAGSNWQPTGRCKP
jgi:quercetin dioxygenase-like cupin family protein